MAQLSDGCFACSDALLSVEGAQRIIAAQVRPVPETERVGLSEADGWVLAKDVLAPIDLPPFANSAVTASRFLPATSRARQPCR